MKLKNIEIKQKKIIKFVKNYFTKGNSPFLKKNYFALFENGEGAREIKKNIFNLNETSEKFFFSKIINLIVNFRYKIFLNKSNKKKHYKNLVITWGNASSLSNGSFVDKYTGLDVKKFKNTFWLILSPNKFIKKNISNNMAVIYPGHKAINCFYFILYINIRKIFCFSKFFRNYFCLFLLVPSCFTSTFF